VPVDEGPVVLVDHGILDNDGPSTNSGFAPEYC
jgi:hypothetical protein